MNAKSFHASPRTRGTRTSRGFVLSFALFVLALFMLVYAQYQSTHLHVLRANELSVWDSFSTSRIADDVHMDLNMLMDQSLRVDQNLSDVILYLSGKLPSDVNVYANLLRYQSSLVQFGTDTNHSIFLDLNAVVGSHRMVGMTDHNLSWSQPYKTQDLAMDALSSQAIPVRVDINVFSSRDYNLLTPWTLAGSGSTYVVLHYEDTNSNHDFTSAGWASSSSTYTYQIEAYNPPTTKLTITFGLIDGNAGSLLIDNNDSTTLSVRYAVRWQMTADANATRAGYALPLTIQGKDTNLSESTQWIYT